MTVADASHPAELTAFPRIEASYSFGIVPDSKGTSKQCLIISWAKLLHGYVAGDVVSFAVDGDIVSVDLSTSAIRRSPVHGESMTGQGSAIYYSTEVLLSRYCQDPQYGSIEVTKCADLASGYILACNIRLCRWGDEASRHCSVPERCARNPCANALCSAFPPHTRKSHASARTGSTFSS